MRQPELEKLLSYGRKQCELLHLETNGILRNLDTWGAEDFDRATAKRQEIIAEIEKTDLARCSYLDRIGGQVDTTTERALDQYILFQKATIEKVLELDSLIMALGRQRLDVIKEGFAEFAQKKVANRAYDDRYGTSDGWIDHNA